MNCVHILNLIIYTFTQAERKCLAFDPATALFIEEHVS